MATNPLSDSMNKILGTTADVGQTGLYTPPDPFASTLAAVQSAYTPPAPVAAAPPPLSAYDAMMAAQGKYYTARDAAVASAAGKAPITYDWRSPQTIKQQSAGRPGTYGVESRHYENAQWDPALEAAADAARTDFEKAMVAYDPSLVVPSVAPVPEYASRTDWLKGEGLTTANPREFASSAGITPQAYRRMAAPERQTWKQEFQAQKPV